VKLQGKVAIVTGASRGVGRNISLELAREGCDIVVAARTEEVKDPRLPGTIHSTSEEIRSLGRRALPVRADVTDEESIDRMVKQALDEFGKIDILINNAGIMAPGSLVDLPLRRWDLMWRVNVRGPIACSRAVLPHMIEQRDGVIINISSVLADVPGGGNIPYSLTKLALRKLSEGLAEEVQADNIRVFALSPEGLVRTPGTTYHRFEETEAVGENIEAPEVMGRAAVFLCTEEAAALAGGHYFSGPLLREHAQT
jgi:NAD(P)-dependent dehydrogenase (short-subunit alcohol dehydrogenase family)